MAVFGRSVRGEDFLGDFEEGHQPPGKYGRVVTTTEKRRYQRALDASIRRADQRLKWHAKQGHTRARGFSLTRRSGRRRYRSR